MLLMVKRGAKKIQADYGMSDYYNYYINNYKSNVNKAVYNKVISEIHLEIIELIINKTYKYRIPYVNFEILLTKNKPNIYMKKGKVVDKRLVDWAATKKLWENDEEAKKNKTIIKFVNNHTNRYIYKISLHRSEAKNVNSNYSMYGFKPSRFFTRYLAKRIKNSTIDEIGAYIKENRNYGFKW